MNRAQFGFFRQNLPAGRAAEFVQINAVLLGEAVLHTVLLVDPRPEFEAAGLNVERETCSTLHVVVEIGLALALCVDGYQVDNVAGVLNNSNLCSIDIFN